MEAIDNVVYSKRLRKPKGELSLFSDTAHFIRLPYPPSNSCLTTGKDMLVVQAGTFVRTKLMELSIKKHDKDSSYALKSYMDLFGLEYDEEYIDQVLEESAIIIREQKNKFNRPRPSQLAPYFSMELNIMKSKTLKSPSYPSGHSTQSRLVAEIYGEKYPDHRTNLLKAADEVGTGRIVAGFHYPTDHKVSIYLAKRLFKALKNNKEENSNYYNRFFDLSTKSGKR